MIILCMVPFQQNYYFSYNRSFCLQVGSGKSSLLNLILGETGLINGSVYRTGSIAYVPQVNKQLVVLMCYVALLISYFAYLFRLLGFSQEPYVITFCLGETMTQGGLFHLPFDKAIRICLDSFIASTFSSQFCLSKVPILLLTSLSIEMMFCMPWTLENSLYEGLLRNHYLTEAYWILMRADTRKYYKLVPWTSIFPEWWEVIWPLLEKKDLTYLVDWELVLHLPGDVILCLQIARYLSSDWVSELSHLLTTFLYLTEPSIMTRKFTYLMISSVQLMHMLVFQFYIMQFSALWWVSIHASFAHITFRFSIHNFLLVLDIIDFFSGFYTFILNSIHSCLFSYKTCRNFSFGQRL